jgi:hypothetical protein
MKLQKGLFICLVLLQACVTRQKCAGKFPCPKITDTLIERNETVIERTKTDTLIKGETVYVQINCDSSKKLPKNTWVPVNPKAESNNAIRIKTDGQGNIDIECTGKDLLIQRLRESISTLQHRQEKTVVHTRCTHWPWWAWVLIGAGGFMALMALLYAAVMALKRMTSDGDHYIG